MILFLIISEIVHIWRLLYIRKHVLDVVALLLHCPVSSVFQTPKIVSVLNGNFSPAKNEMSKRNEQFFHDVLDCVPDAVITCKTDFTIVDSNGYSNKLLGIDASEYRNKLIDDLFLDLQMNADIKKIAPTQNQSEVLKTSGSFKRGNDGISVEIEMSHVGTFLVYVIRDVTQTVRYNTLIAEEKQKK